MSHFMSFYEILAFYCLQSERLYQIICNVYVFSWEPLIYSISSKCFFLSLSLFIRLMGLHKDKPKGEWKTHIPFLSFKSRISDANEKSNENIAVHRHCMGKKNKKHT